MRRAIHRVASRLAGIFSRLAQAVWRSPGQERTAAWLRDRGDATRRLDYDLDGSAVVLDLGGYEGQWASDIFGRFACTIHVFEPVPEFADRIAARFARNPKIRLHRVGLAGREGTATIALAADASSTHAPAAPGAPRRSIALRAAAEFFREQGIGTVDLMKINIEGGEYELLEHLIEGGLIGRIRHLQVQFHDFVPDAARRMEAIQSRLMATHSLTWQYRFVWENWRRRDPA
ncbi:MAG TPA: FkbM family methyltransferase [Candidatus Polarisedimenticolia bacterium]